MQHSSYVSDFVSHQRLVRIFCRVTLPHFAGNFGRPTPILPVAFGDEARVVFGAASGHTLGPLVRLGWGAFSAHTFGDHRLPPSSRSRWIPLGRLVPTPTPPPDARRPGSLLLPHSGVRHVRSQDKNAARPHPTTSRPAHAHAAPRPHAASPDPGRDDTTPTADAPTRAPRRPRRRTSPPRCRTVRPARLAAGSARPRRRHRRRRRQPLGLRRYHPRRRRRRPRVPRPHPRTAATRRLAALSAASPPSPSRPPASTATCCS